MEEILALRAELASTKEELASTKKELQSTKEELAVLKGENEETNLRIILRPINCTSDDPELHLRNVNLLSDIMDFISTMTHLKSIDLDGSSGFSVGISHLCRLPHLEKLNLGETDILDNGLEGIDAAGSLTELSLSGTDVSAAGLRHLTSLSSLRRLELDYCFSVESAAMMFVRLLTGLEALLLGGTAVGDYGLKLLTSLDRLKELSLPRGVTDVGMEHVMWLTALEELDLWDCTTMTQRGLECLTNLPSLK